MDRESGTTVRVMWRFRSEISKVCIQPPPAKVGDLKGIQWWSRESFIWKEEGCLLCRE